jgi:hypothetical protein
MVDGLGYGIVAALMSKIKPASIIKYGENNLSEETKLKIIAIFPSLNLIDLSNTYAISKLDSEKEIQKIRKRQINNYKSLGIDSFFDIHELNIENEEQFNAFRRNKIKNSGNLLIIETKPEYINDIVLAIYKKPSLLKEFKQNL